MNVHVFRPKVSDLVFQLYGRPLHPELFDILASRRIQREDYDLTVRITRTGHVLTWENADVLLTEVAGIDCDLSDKRRLLHYRMRGEHSGVVRCAGSITYETSFQVETMTPEIYLHVHGEILSDGCKRGLLHNFQPNHRLSVAPLGFISAEARPGCLLVSTFHTFPEELTVVKSQTLIERRAEGRACPPLT